MLHHKLAVEHHTSRSTLVGVVEEQRTFPPSFEKQVLEACAQVEDLVVVEHLQALGSVLFIQI